MKVLVINCGSSSLKYQLIDMEGEQVLCKGLCERIGIDGGNIEHKAKGSEWTKNVDMADHSVAFAQMVEMMSSGEGAVIASKDEIDAIGHRVVQGAEDFTQSVVVNDEVLAAIKKCVPLAPLHNPANLQGLRSALDVFGDKVPQVAVFDTSFHQTMRPKAFLYGIPYDYYKDYGIRRYGFHGTSHRFVSAKAAEYLGKDPKDLKIVTCHLGNGSSIAAVSGGESWDTTMGLTPVAGLIMGTRCGDIDPSVVTYLQEVTGMSPKEVGDMMNKKSGFLGISGVSSDNRDVEEAARNGNEQAGLVHKMLSWQIRKYIGAYAAIMEGLDCVVFTGGIGENSSFLREKICKKMGFLGLGVDVEQNKKRGLAVNDISSADARVKTLVIQTNEELMIARDTQTLVAAR